MCLLSSTCHSSKNLFLTQLFFCFFILYATPSCCDAYKYLTTELFNIPYCSSFLQQFYIIFYETQNAIIRQSIDPCLYKIRRTKKHARSIHKHTGAANKKRSGGSYVPAYTKPR